MEGWIEDWKNGRGWKNGRMEERKKRGRMGVGRVDRRLEKDGGVEGWKRNGCGEESKIGRVVEGLKVGR